jgi:GT2 family glycosyltransferase
VSRVAVIVVNYNAGAMLQDCLAALARQTVRPARVLVMDNGSRDGSIEACRRLFPWAEFHLLGTNEGFAKANNVAVGLVPDCEWVALLNPDAFADPGWLAAFQRRAAEYPETDAFASCMLWATDPRIVDGAGDAYRVDGLAWPRQQGGQAADLPREPEEVFSPSAGAGFYRRAAFVDAGGFCERYFCYYEDVDLGFRLRLRGHCCRFLPDAVVRHVGSALTGKGSEFSVYHAHRNFVWTYVRNMPGFLVWIYLPAHLAANVASMFVFLRKGHGSVILRAKWHAIRGLVQTLRERRRIQAQRTVSPDAVLAAMQRGNLFLWAYRRALHAVGLRRL